MTAGHLAAAFLEYASMAMHLILLGTDTLKRELQPARMGGASWSSITQSRGLPFGETRRGIKGIAVYAYCSGLLPALAIQRESCMLTGMNVSRRSPPLIAWLLF